MPSCHCTRSGISRDVVIDGRRWRATDRVHARIVGRLRRGKLLCRKHSRRNLARPARAAAHQRALHRHEQLSEYPEAVQDYDKAIEMMGPGNAFVPTIMVSRAMVKKKMGNLTDCLTELQQAADLLHMSLVRGTRIHAQHRLCMAQSTLACVHTTHRFLRGTQEELVKQFEIRLDAGVMSPRRHEPIARRKSVTFAMAAPETGGRSSLAGTTPAPKKQLRFSDAVRSTRSLWCACASRASRASCASCACVRV